MPISFEEMLSNKKSISDLVEAANPEKSNDKKSYKDERFWKPTVDKAGNGYAVIRFLPNRSGDVPWVRYWDHGFQGPTGQWYIEKSLTSIGQADPVSEANSKLWATGTDENKDLVRKRKRRLHYIANILVVSDPKNPQNEGKVFLYEFGKKIFDKISDMMQPQFEDESPVDPFDYFEGADFKLKIRNVEGYRNYDKSEFTKSEPLLDGDKDKLKEVFESSYDLAEFTDAKNFKTYEQLAQRLAVVLGEKPATTIRQDTDLAETKSPTPIKEKASPVEVEESLSSDEDDDTLAYFEKLAQED